MRKALLLPLFCLPLFSQTGTGSIQGTVRDASSAVIPNAAVKAVHVDTAREYQTNANETGFYLFPAVQMAKYSRIVSTVARRGAWVIGGGTAGQTVDPGEAQKHQDRYAAELAARGWFK